MTSPELLEAFRNAGAVFRSDDPAQCIEHFGAPKAELKTAEDGAVVCPLTNLIRIRATGKDRAKFLHNFCTNNISAMKVGDVCEAFFTDVKAKILAHGLICAFEDVHEIWMLSDDDQVILNHLNRYVITEDVAFESATDQTTFAVLGSNATAILETVGFSLSDDLPSCVNAAEVLCCGTTWIDRPLAMLSTTSENGAALWQKLTQAGATPTGNIVFEHVRVLEGYPVIGVDLTSDNMAPEANRNAQSISYTKGCYLGQEPIARLDAMGHVNRQLYKATARIVDAPTADDESPTVTSASQVGTDSFPVLIPMPVKVANASSPLTARLPDGTIVELTIGG